MSFGNQAARIETNGRSAERILALVPLFREIGNLKRIRAANLSDSFAVGLFKLAWGKISDGENARRVAVDAAKDAVIAASLGAIDADVLRAAELADEQIELILTRAFDANAAPLDSTSRREMRERIAPALREKNEFPAPPDFVDLLIRQPRSGATKTGAPKRIFDQPENHAEHCLTVAVYGYLLADIFNADAEAVFLVALAHHFHNAYLPDSGFAGEEALDEFLPQIFDSFRRKCLAELSSDLHKKIRELLAAIETANTPEARAFHAADVIDRVLQMRHHAETNEFTLRYAMEEAELVHAGQVQDFHYEILRVAGLV